MWRLRTTDQPTNQTTTTIPNPKPYTGLASHLWCCSGAVLVLLWEKMLWCSSGAPLGKLALVVLWWCSDAALVLIWSCFGAALVLLGCWSAAALLLLWCCSAALLLDDISVTEQLLHGLRMIYRCHGINVAITRDHPRPHDNT